MRGVKDIAQFFDEFNNGIESFSKIVLKIDENFETKKINSITPMPLLSFIPVSQKFA